MRIYHDSEQVSYKFTMWLHTCTLHWLLLVVFAEEFSHPLSSRLNRWHTLKPEDIRLRRHRRSVNNDGSILPLDKEISFDAFDKTFTLSLMPSPEIFAHDFQAFVQTKRGTHEVSIDKSSVMTGKVLGDANSEVTAHLNGEVLTANIFTDNETYVIEPLWRHVDMPQAQASHSNGGFPTEDHSRDMLVYRQSDLNLMHLQHPHSERGFCDTKDLMKEFRRSRTKNTDELNQLNDADNSLHLHRDKRAADPTKKICKLSLVADHRFYQEMGNSSSLETMYYLINLIERVNRIYKNTDWGSGTSTKGKYTGYGFQIGNITIHNESSALPRYNQERANPSWKAKDLLEAFSEDRDRLSTCLSHLFTYVDFSRGLLGLAYVGSDRADDVGGICTDVYDRGHGKPPLYLNTGLTSTINWGKRILTTEADLVTAHELGHNFGAEHDDDTAATGEESCTPGQSNNGNYIMYPAAVSGQYPNNKKFSSCSKHTILLSLKRKAPLCFQEDSKSFCGNYQVETQANETCDVGYLTVEDKCCLPNCKLREGAKCSNKNSPCCTDDCQVADSRKLCRASIPNLCYQDAYCDGKNFECPPSDPVPDNTTCGDEGKCMNGHCIQFCYTKNLQPCLCSTKDEYCLRCCAPLNVSGDEMTRSCRPYIEDSAEGDIQWPQTLPENSKCELGYCSKGECQRNTQDVIARVWDIFRHIAPDKIGEFLADNIVGAVLVFSLLFWIPCSCMVNFVDKKRLKARKNEEQWWTDRGAEYSRSSVYRGAGGGSAPVTPRIRIQRNNMNFISAGVARSGFGAREQWRASQERGMALKKSLENLDEGAKLSVVPGSPSNSAALSHSQPSLSHLAVNGNDVRPPFVRTGAISHSRSQPSLASPQSSSEKSFEEVKPIAASSTTDLSLDGELTIVSNPNKNFALYRRPGLHRQEATFSPN